VYLPINFVHDAVHDFLKERPFKLNCHRGLEQSWPEMNYAGLKLTCFCRHEIRGGHRSENYDISVDALVSHDSYGAAWINCSICLRDLIVQTGFADLGDEDVVGLSCNCNFLCSHFSKDPDGDSGYLIVSWCYIGEECTSYGLGMDAVGSVSENGAWSLG
jgi:hypothetical protein